MARNLSLILLFLISTAAIVSGATTKIIKENAKCGKGIEGICAPETQCSTGVPSFCIPSKFFSNSSTSHTEVIGHGPPKAAPESISAVFVPVFLACVDSEFRGNCLEVSVVGNFCAGLGVGWADELSSIEILDTRFGCNFWVNSNCIGDSINIDSGAIFDLSATNYNDRTVAFNCYSTGR